MNNPEEKINKIIDAFKDVKPSAVTHVSIKHDADCPAIKTQNLSDCNCDPEIQKGEQSQ